MSPLVDDVQQQIQSDFEAQVAKVQEALKFSPKELEQAAKTNTDLMYISLEDKAGINKRRALLNAFYGSFSPEQRLRILRGEVLIPDKSVINTVDSYHTPLQFNAQRMPGFLTPTLYIGTAEGLSYGAIGNGINDEQWHDRIANQWYFGGKRRTLPIEAVVIKQPKNPQPLPVELSTETAAKDSRETFSPYWPLLWKTAEAMPLSILAIPTEHLPIGVSVFNSGASVPTEPYGMTLSAALAPMNKRPLFFQYQCQKNFLLLRDTSAPFSKRIALAN